jgi:hypothetical protein
LHLLVVVVLNLGLASLELLLTNLQVALLVAIELGLLARSCPVPASTAVVSVEPVSKYSSTTTLAPRLVARATMALPEARPQSSLRPR